MIYPKHAAAMGKTDRLSPPVLAAVDPQAFWGALLWLKHFIWSLDELGIPEGLIQEWKDLEDGKRTGRNKFEQCMKVHGCNAVDLKGQEDNWGISGSSKDVHVCVATD
eukprot:scaffold6797_cov62-Cylindrotheca_fusiformis.AAC.3